MMQKVRINTPFREYSEWTKRFWDDVSLDAVADSEEGSGSVVRQRKGDEAKQDEGSLPIVA